MASLELMSQDAVTDGVTLFFIRKTDDLDFRRFPKTYFRFPGRHVDTSGIDVTELYTALKSSGGVLDNVSKAHHRIF